MNEVEEEDTEGAGCEGGWNQFTRVQNDRRRYSR